MSLESLVWVLLAHDKRPLFYWAQLAVFSFKGLRIQERSMGGLGAVINRDMWAMVKETDSYSQAEEHLQSG